MKKPPPITHINLSINIDFTRLNEVGQDRDAISCDLVTERPGQRDIYHTLTGVDARGVLAAALPALEQAHERSLDESLGAIHYVTGADGEKIPVATYSDMLNEKFISADEVRFAGPETTTSDSTADISGQMREANAKMNSAASRLRDAGRAASAKALKAWGRLQLFPAGEPFDGQRGKYGRISPEGFGGNVKPPAADGARPPERPSPRPVGMVGERGPDPIKARPAPKPEVHTGPPKPIPPSVVSDALKRAKGRTPISASISSIDFGATTISPDSAPTK